MSAKSSYDLTPSMAPFFDPHMVGPLLDYLREVATLTFNTYLSFCLISFLKLFFVVELIDDLNISRSNYMTQK